MHNAGQRRSKDEDAIESQVQSKYHIIVFMFSENIDGIFILFIVLRFSVLLLLPFLLHLLVRSSLISFFLVGDFLQPVKFFTVYFIQFGIDI